MCRGWVPGSCRRDGSTGRRRRRTVLPWPVASPAVLRRSARSRVSRGRAEPADHLHCRGRASLGRAGRQRPVCDKYVGGAGVPADPDPDLGLVGLGEQGDVGDQGAEQPFAVPGAGSRARSTGRAGQQRVSPGRPGWAAVAACLWAAWSACSASVRAASLASQRASRERATSRFSGSTGAEGPLGPVSVVAGAFHRELGGPAGPLVPARDLIGGRQRQGDLPGGQRVQQRARDGGIHAGRGDRPARRRGQPVPARAALIGWPLIGVVVGSSPACRRTRSR